MADFTHLDDEGRARMVDVGQKPTTHRVAVAAARVRMEAETRDRLFAGEIAKGDVLAAARLGGIMAAKRTPELIPLCHGIALTRVEVELERCDAGVDIRARAEAQDRTGVEMEAMVAASTAALIIYDMCKAVERGMVVESVRLEEKSGGRSGHWRRGASEG